MSQDSSNWPQLEAMFNTCTPITNPLDFVDTVYNPLAFSVQVCWKRRLSSCCSLKSFLFWFSVCFVFSVFIINNFSFAVQFGSNRISSRWAL